MKREKILKIFNALSRRNFLNWIPDALYLKVKYRLVKGKHLNLKNPESFNEKLQWLKLHDRNPKYPKMVDKYLAKQYVADIIGEEYIIPTLGVWERFDDIGFEHLPEKFVLKCTHDSGGVVIVENKDTFDYEEAKKKIEKTLKKNFYWMGREWPYKSVKPRIIAETYLDMEDQDLCDYKLMCFNGKVKSTFVCSDRFSPKGLHITCYDEEWKRLPFKRSNPTSETEINKPGKYKEMVELAEKLSENIPFIRVDFYEVKGKVYFGELTLYPASGLGEFSPKEWDYILGKWLKL